GGMSPSPRTSSAYRPVRRSLVSHPRPAPRSAVNSSPFSAVSSHKGRTVSATASGQMVVDVQMPRSALLPWALAPCVPSKDEARCSGWKRAVVVAIPEPEPGLVLAYRGLVVCHAGAPIQETLTSGARGDKHPCGDW